MRLLRLLPWLALQACVCGDRQAFTTPLPDDGTFATGTPTEVERERCRLAADYSRRHDGVGFLVVRGQEVLCEEQQNGNAEPTPHHLFSGTKSFSCALAVVLATDGTLDLDAPAARVLDEWKGVARKEAITPRHLLHFTSGLAVDQARLTTDGLKVDQKVADKYALALSEPAEHDPGTHYEYGSVHLEAFGALVKRATGKDPVALLQERVFAPLAFRTSGWNADPSGNSALPYGAWTTLREWAKYGVFIRDGGKWKGQPVLDPARLAECFQGSAALPGYGQTFWLNQPVPKAVLEGAETPVKQTDGVDGPLFYAQAPADLVVAAGYNDQRLYIIPSRGLVIGRLGNGSVTWSDAAFLARVLDGVER